MLFTDIIFPIFFALFFGIYWLILRRNLPLRNCFLLAASYLFYGWWDWRFLLLIILTSASTFTSALLFQRTRNRAWIIANIILNLGILLTFKYFNFFSENIGRLFFLFGMNLDWFTIDVLLPVGISFYTFQAISYSVDVMRGNTPPCRNPVDFFTFIAYFPQLVAGPIERAYSLLPQISTLRQWDYTRAVSGMRMLLFGLLKKLCVSDMLAIYVERIFSADSHISPLMALLGGILFTLQIYCDFSAYSEIARGVSRMLGIELMANFRFPLFARNILDFWQRWHISLMLWFRDYLYIPLGGNRRGNLRTALNTSLVFILSGLWHGAGWNFILWGAYWAICYAIGRHILSLRRVESPISLPQLPSILLTFGVVAFGFYIFRCSSAPQILSGLSSLWLYILFFAGAWALASISIPLLRRISIPATPCLISLSLAAIAASILLGKWVMLLKFWWIFPALMVLAIEWHSRNGDYPFCNPPRRRTVRYLLYWAIALCILISEPTDMAFIYFQF